MSTNKISHEILFGFVFINRPVLWSNAMLHLCFLAQPFTRANLPVFGVVLQVLMQLLMRL